MSILKLTSILIFKKNLKRSQNKNWKFNRKRKKSNQQKKHQSKLIEKDATAVIKKLDCWGLSANAGSFTAVLTDFLNNIHANLITKKSQMTDLNKLWSRSTMARLQAFDYFFSFILFLSIFNEPIFYTFAFIIKKTKKLIDFLTKKRIFNTQFYCDE